MKSKKVQLGHTGLEVSQLIFGTDEEQLKAKSPRESGKILNQAYEEYGVNHWDTAFSYGTHPHVGAGLKMARRQEIVVTSKIRSKSAKETKDKFHRTLQELKTDYLDIGFIHYVRPGELSEYEGALDAWMEFKKAGKVSHIGVSTHSPQVVRECSKVPELEVVCAPLNYKGTHIDEGTLEDMKSALQSCHGQGKGVYIIKVLGRGQLTHDARRAIEFVGQFPFVDAFCIGMHQISEVKENLALLADTYRS